MEHETNAMMLYTRDWRAPLTANCFHVAFRKREIGRKCLGAMGSFVFLCAMYSGGCSECMVWVFGVGMCFGGWYEVSLAATLTLLHYCWHVLKHIRVCWGSWRRHNNPYIVRDVHMYKYDFYIRSAVSEKYCRWCCTVSGVLNFYYFRWWQFVEHLLLANMFNYRTSQAINAVLIYHFTMNRSTYTSSMINTHALLLQPSVLFMRTCNFAHIQRRNDGVNLN